MDAKVSAPVYSNWADTDLAQSTTYEPVLGLGEDVITISSALDNMSVSSPYTVTGAIGTSHFPNTIWTTGTGTTISPWATHNPTGVAPKITLNGEGADVEVNGWSLVAAVKRIEERLGLFQPNPELEKEWEDLQALGEQYRKLEQHIKDKQATFDRLRAMPAPDIE